MIDDFDLSILHDFALFARFSKTYPQKFLIPGSLPVAYGTIREHANVPLYIAECQMSTDPNPEPVNVPFLTEEDLKEEEKSQTRKAKNPRT